MEKQTSLTQEEIDVIIYDARVGDLEELKEIFEEVDINLIMEMQDEFNLSTPIHMAAANGHYKVIRYLLDELKDKKKIKDLIDKKNESGNTALHWAAINGELKVVNILCEKYGANPFLVNNANHDSIYEASNNNKEKVEEYFLLNYAIEKTEDGEDSKKNEIEFKEGKETVEIKKELIEKDLLNATNNLRIK
ncbi:Yar1p [Ascoidea rubescens DSM 1968]|uniref:Ankyrin n=1 Tax=Ascoidea rubescens DSM 1968 TaxID=1344418 RepID=A0A1D2V942_9ASCO|nr:ankyrin [Ascoidea rubescens DSM 1968]ODV58079.1 ankyrin [Ascoidea rubescens DSM 1968]